MRRTVSICTLLALGLMVFAGCRSEKPETVELETAQPETVQPETVEPETVEPEIVEPEIVELETVTNSVGMKFRLIPAGEFMMGSSDSPEELAKAFPGIKPIAFEDEFPQHKVRITKPFYLGVTEVTQEQYEKVMGTNPSSFSETAENEVYAANKVKGLDTSSFPVQSDAKKLGLFEGHCPNCGDTIRLNQSDNCASCDALLRSGEYDWVLSEITQGCVWRRRDQRELELADRYRALHDPGYNIQHVEDRASVIFWRKAMADRLGTTRPLLKVATSEICQKFDAEYQSNHNNEAIVHPARPGERLYFGNCSVGSVDIRGINEEDDCDFTIAEVHWSAHIHGVSQDGATRDHGRWKRYESLFVLMRRKGVKTNIRGDF